MAKVPFSKLKCKINEEIKTISFNDETIEVKQYLPVQEKLILLSKIILVAHEEDYNYSNPAKVEILRDLEILFAYTNINFTDKQKEDIAKLYDLCYTSGLLAEVIAAIPEKEYKLLCDNLEKSLTSIYQYENSALGILDNIKQNHDENEFDLKNIQEILQSDELGMLKDIVTKLG